jgi:exodeoxyribonuclease III
VKIASWNINGIRARREALPAWIQRQKPDILVLQEVKALEGEIPQSIRNLEGYHAFWNGSTFRKGYSGTGILVRDESFSPGTRWEIPPFDIENRTVVLHTEAFTLIGTYVPRGEGDEHYLVKLQYLEALRQFTRTKLSAGHQIILAGDMNVAHHDIDVHRSQNKPDAIGLRREERAAIDAHLSIGLHDIMRERNPDKKNLFTWWPPWKYARERNLGWRIDCFYLSEPLAGSVAGAEVDLDEKSSDHAPILLELSNFT